MKIIFLCRLLTITMTYTTIEELYTHATNPYHPYYSSPELASSLLSHILHALHNLPSLSDPSALPLAISYILVESVCITHTPTTPYKPHNTMVVTSILRGAIESDVDLDSDMSRVEEIVLGFASVVLPWLWRASHHGIQSDFVQNMVCP
jgi:hypothetical protein